MKGMTYQNLQKYVHNYNREVRKNIEHQPFVTMNLECIMGVNSQNIKGSAIFALNNEEVLYYSSDYFVAHNLITKEYAIIRRQNSNNNTVVFLKKFVLQNGNKLIICIEKSTEAAYIGILEISGVMIDPLEQNRKVKNYNWRLHKLFNKTNFTIESLAFHAKKGYLYLLISKGFNQKNDKMDQSLWIYDINREIAVLNSEIKLGAGKAKMSYIFVCNEPTEIYLIGQNYFRYWSINFNEKHIKESNYRNIERYLKDKIIVQIIQNTNCPSKQIIVLTQVEAVFVSKNEIIGSCIPPRKSIKQGKCKQNIESEVESSLNQIYKMKLLFDDDNQNSSKQTKKDYFRQDSMNDFFKCASEPWATSKSTSSIAIGTSRGTLLIYSLNSCQLKITNQYPNKSFDICQQISTSPKGQIILTTASNSQRVYVINQYSLHHEEGENQMKRVWGEGYVDKQTIISVDSPGLHNKMCTLGKQGTIRFWDLHGKQRRILFEQKLMHSPNGISIHPCGLLVAINFSKEIKLYSILPNTLQEVISVKTNYNSFQLKYTDNGNYLVSNERNLLIFYNPFTLKSVGYIEPPELKSFIADFQISSDGEYICYICSDHCIYFHTVDFGVFSKFQNVQPAHFQQEAYTCFHFDPYIGKQIKQSQNKQIQNIFIGFTKNKYMVIYKNFGKDLIAQFPVEDCYITHICVSDHNLFAATSKGTLRAYNWPILEEHCELQIIDIDSKKLKLKAPQYKEFYLWNSSISMSLLYKLKFSNQIVIFNDLGAVSMISFQQQKSDKSIPQEKSVQRKKMIQIINDTFFISKIQSQKRNKLLQKTENDILKVDNEISKEKCVMERKFRDAQKQLIKTFNQKNELHNEEKSAYLKKIRQQISELQIKLKKTVQNHHVSSENMNKVYDQKRKYEEQRNKAVEQQTQKIISSHKDSNSLINIDIKRLMHCHKQKIKQTKLKYAQTIKEMQNEFEEYVEREYPDMKEDRSIRQHANNSNKNLKKRKTSLKRMTNPTLILSNQVLFKQTLEKNDDLKILTDKVDQIDKQNLFLEQNLAEIKSKVQKISMEDEIMQKQFQKCLEDYNSNRFTNLSLHSEVLKMRNQLIQRKQIIENKQKIVNLAFQERQKLQNYKELVKGSLTKLQEKKQSSHNLYLSKESEITLTFSQLINQINLLEEKKIQFNSVASILQITHRQLIEKENIFKDSIIKLKELKKFLLLQGLNQDAQQKKLYLEQQNLLTTINFYKKRMNMEFIKEKKNKLLKKSALNLVLKQNKNLLQECNQLRSQAISYEHEIKNLGKKLGEANKVISIQNKLKTQKSTIGQQRSQLQAIRAMFNQQIDTYNTRTDELDKIEQ